MSNNNEAEVKVEKDDGVKTRWGQGVFYRQEGHKLVFKSELATKLVVVVTIILVIAMLFKDSPYETKEEDTSIDTPHRVSNYQGEIKLETYSDTKEDKSKAQKKKQVIQIEPLKLVSRENSKNIPLGLSAMAKLLTGATNGPVKAKLLDDLELNGEIFIKEGSILWGQGSSTDKRLLVKFLKFVNEDGVSQKIHANAFDSSDQILGLKGSIIGRTSKKILAGAGLGVAGALQNLQQSENQGGVSVVKPNVENALLNGASSAALGLAQQELEDLKNQQTIIEVKKGTKILVVFGKI